ncbi:T9SS type A sorting domain-containing protein [Sabulilitoribacter arenilitoris]|uniref:T9SS type A sorting domain-containing protein n=1 Tax=Wocania arenilitoris TaxID=2044858 RepID=A0AAE3JKD4_9FLAO|nr:M43 family zinc metalloprotease [Wocania arenilitoris]MCF7567054.1 T9SS type A sorting domain-containing protein [Wocania arenilitoris]
MFQKKVNFFSLIIMLLALNLLYAQSSNEIRCGFTPDMENYNDIVSTEKQSKLTANKISDCYQHYVIPVVFHVFHDSGSGAVPLSQVQSAVDRVNNEFRGLNADFNTVSPEFMGIRGTLDLTLALAKIDPNGNPTSGVVYYPNNAGFGSQTPTINQLISATAWDNYKYMNVYIMLDLYDTGVTNNSGIAWGPSTTMSDNGLARIVYNYRYLGDHGSSIASENFQSVFTHEVGHWLNLKHTFQNGCDDPGDFVDDTPPTENVSGCQPNNFSCGNLVNEENYMDYTDCYSMFTLGQIDRVKDALNHPARTTIWQYDNLVATGVNQYYTHVIPTAEFVASRTTVTVGGAILFTNQSCGFPDQWDWTINGADQEIVTTENATAVFNTAGTYTVQLIASNSMGSSAPFTLTVNVEEAVSTCQYFFDFENETLDAAASGWTDNNLPAGAGWFVKGAVLHPYNEVGNFTSLPYSGSKALTNLNNWVGGGPIEMRLISPEIDLTNISQPSLSYYDIRGWDLYWPVNKPNHTVQVFVSSNPSGPYTLLHTDIANSSDFQSWRHIENISLEDYANQKIYISFRTDTHHYYWRFDDICISGTSSLSVNDFSGSQPFVKVYPNPVNDILVVDTSINDAFFILFDLYGKEIIRTKSTEINLSNIKPGLYILKILFANNTQQQTKKIIKL